MEAVAAELRAPELAPERAGELVDESARLAAQAAAELERLSRTAAADPGETAGQERLLP